MIMTDVYVQVTCSLWMEAKLFVTEKLLEKSLSCRKGSFVEESTASYTLSTSSTAWHILI